MVNSGELWSIPIIPVRPETRFKPRKGHLDGGFAPFLHLFFLLASAFAPLTIKACTHKLFAASYSPFQYDSIDVAHVCGVLKEVSLAMAQNEFFL